MSIPTEPIAVTGVGAVSPMGLGVACLLDGLLECRCALAAWEEWREAFGVAPMVARVAEPLEVAPQPGFRLSRTDQLAVLAAEEAAAGAELREAGVIMATTVGGLPAIEKEVAAGPRVYYRQGGFAAASAYPISHAADVIGARFGLAGPRLGLSVACSSGAMAVAMAARMIRQGVAPVMLAGGSDALCPFTLSGFHALQALDTAACRPFDQNRNGLNLGEAAAVVVLESLEHARRRGARVRALLRGWAMTNDAFHPTAPHEQGLGVAECIAQAMRAAGVRADQIGYVNAHGTGTPLNDAAEVKAYEAAFAGRRRPVPVSSTKSYVGHTLGAAGALEAVVTILGIQSGALFPTLRLERPIESPAVDWLTGAPRRATLPVAMSVSAGFGGSNTCLIFSEAPQ